jgi:hypothetical protein
MLPRVAAVERTAVLVIRAWLETGLEDGAVRARIVATPDVSTRARVETAAVSEDEILDAVASWLRSFLAGRG